MIKKIVGYSMVSLCAVAFIVSCKHEIPAGTGTPVGGGSGGGGTGGGTGGGGNTGSTCSPDTVYFQQQVLPIFISNCSLSGCHDAASHQDGVVLTNYNSIINTGDIEPFDPNDSEVWEKITENDPSDRMPPPPRNPLSQQQKDLIRKWILQGAKNNSCQTAACDSANVTYSGTVRTIIANKCQGCHSSSAPAGGYDFSQYAVLKARVTDGKLWGAINHLPGYSPMPKNGNKLSDCELGQIRKWIDAGSPNN